MERQRALRRGTGVGRRGRGTVGVSCLTWNHGVEIINFNVFDKTLPSNPNHVTRI